MGRAGATRVWLVSLAFFAFVFRSSAAPIYLSPTSSTTISTTSPCSSTCTEASPCAPPTNGATINIGSGSCAQVLFQGGIGYCSTCPAISIYASGPLTISSYGMGNTAFLMLDLTSDTSLNVTDIGFQLPPPPMNWTAPIVTLNNMTINDMLSGITVTTMNLLVLNSNIMSTSHNAGYMLVASLGSYPASSLSMTVSNTVFSSKLTPYLLTCSESAMSLVVSNTSSSAPSFFNSGGVIQLLDVSDSSFTNLADRWVHTLAGISKLNIIRSTFAPTAVFGSQTLLSDGSSITEAFISLSSFNNVTLDYITFANSVIMDNTFLDCDGVVSVSGNVSIERTIWRYLESAQRGPCFVGSGSLHLANCDFIPPSSSSSGNYLTLGLNRATLDATSNISVSNLYLDRASFNVDGYLSVSSTLLANSSSVSTISTSASTAVWTLASLSNPASNNIILDMTSGTFIYNVTGVDGILRDPGGSGWTLPENVSIVWNYNFEPAINFTSKLADNVAFYNGGLPYTQGLDDFSVSFSLSSNGTLWFEVTDVVCYCDVAHSTCTMRHNCTCDDHWNGTVCDNFLVDQGTCSGAPPGEQFTCVNGIWVGFNPPPSPSITLPPGQTVVVEGNLTTGVLVLNGQSGGLNTTGCITVQNGIQIELTADQTSSNNGRFNLHQSGSNCPDLTTVPVTVKVPSSVCKQASSNTQAVSDGFTVLFTLSGGHCLNVGAVVGGTLAAVAVLAVAAAVGMRWYLSKIKHAQELPKS